MDRAIAIFVFFLVFGVGAVLVTPSFVDWNQYRDEIESYAEYLTGRDVTIDGDIEFVLLPYPALTMANFAVANLDEASDSKMISLQRLELRAALRPLIMGDIQITDLRMVKPQIALEVLAGNTTNWRLDPSDEAEAPVRREWPWWLSAMVNALRFDVVTIEDGTLTYSDPSRGMRELVGGLNGTFSAETINGPFRADGTAILRGVELQFDWLIGDTSVLRAVPARVNATFASSKAAIGFKGFLEEASLFGTISGDLTFSVPDAGQGLNELFTLIRGGPVAAPKGAAAQVLAQDLTMETKLKISGPDVSAQDLVVGLGGMRAKGTIGIQLGRVPKFQAVLSARSINLDALLEEKPEQQRVVNLDKAAQSIESELEGFILPTNLVGTINLQVDGIIYRAGVIQDFAIEGIAKDGKIEVRQATGRLPGKASLTGSGTWSPAKGGTDFTGNIAAEVDNPRAMLNWLGYDVANVDSNFLSQMQVTSEVESSPDDFRLQNAVMTLDGETLKGDYAFTVGTPDQYDLSLSAPTLDMDAYVSLMPANGPWAAWRSPPWQDDDAEADEYNTSVVLKAAQLSWNGRGFTDVDVDVSRIDGRLVINRFMVGDTDGVKINLTGEFTSFFPQPNFLLSGNLESDSLKSLLELFELDVAAAYASGNRSVVSIEGALTPNDGQVEINAGVRGSNGGSVALDGVLRKGAENYELVVNSNASDGSRIAISGITKTAESISDFSAKGRVAADDLAELAQAYGFQIETKSEAPVDLTAQIDVAEDRFQLTGLKGFVGDATIDAQGVAELLDDKTKFEGHVQLANLDFDMFKQGRTTILLSTDVQSEEDLMTLEEQIFGSEQFDENASYEWIERLEGTLAISVENISRGKIDFKSANGTLNANSGVFVMPDLTAEVFGGTLAGQVSYSAGELLPELEANLTAKNAQLAPMLAAILGIDSAISPLDGVADLAIQVSALGRRSAPYLSSMNGALTIAAADGHLNGFDVVAFRDRLNQSTSLDDYGRAVRETMTSGTTAFESLYGELTINEGKLIAVSKEEPFLAIFSPTRITDEMGVGTLTVLGEMDLTVGIMNGEGIVALESEDEAPPLKIRLTGPFKEPSRQIESAALGAFYVDDFAARSNSAEKTEADRQIDVFRAAIERLDVQSQD